jgi:hypothetical protein
MNKCILQVIQNAREDERMKFKVLGQVPKVVTGSNLSDSSYLGHSEPHFPPALLRVAFLLRDHGHSSSLSLSLSLSHGQRFVALTTFCSVAHGPVYLPHPAFHVLTPSRY